MCRWQSEHELPDGRAGATEHWTDRPSRFAAGGRPGLARGRARIFLGPRAEFPELPLRLISALAEGGTQLGADPFLADEAMRNQLLRFLAVGASRTVKLPGSLFNGLQAGVVDCKRLTNPILASRAVTLPRVLLFVRSAIR